MSTQTEKAKDNPLVKLVKKSVGLPTGESGCCGAVAQDKEQDKEIGSCCDEQPSTAEKTPGCGCGATESS